MTLSEQLATIEKQIILRALRANKQHRARTAEALGLTVRTLYLKITEHALGTLAATPRSTTKAATRARQAKRAARTKR